MRRSYCSTHRTMGHRERSSLLSRFSVLDFQNEGKRSRKGFVITLDAIVALSFMLLALYFIQAMSFNPTAMKGIQLKQFSLDSLSVMEKSGSLGKAITGNTTAARDILLYSPEPYCMQLSIRAMNGSSVATIDKPGCMGAQTEVQISHGAFRFNGILYSTTLRSWFREEVNE